MFKSKLGHGDKVVLVDDSSGARSPIGSVFEVDMGTVTISVNGLRIDIDGETLKGKTIFGSCTAEIKGAKNMCPKCKTKKQTGNYCSECGTEL